MKQLYFFLILLLPLSLFGFDFKSISADYDVSFGLLGQVGSAHATITIESGTYKIRIEAEGKGIASFVSRHRKEIYESTGIVRQGQLIPMLFVKNRTWGSKEERKRYFFNHKDKSVIVVKTSVDGGKVTESRQALGYYATNDILTIFFNLPHLIGKGLSPTKLTTLHAVGASKQDGHLSVEAPQGKQKESIKQLLKKENHVLIVILNQKVFASKNGEFFVNINDVGISDAVVLKDIFWYGDLVGKMKNLKIEKQGE